MAEFGFTRGHWTFEEDQVILHAIARGESKWSDIAKLMPSNRIGKQCRERWFNHLNPDLKKSAWTEEEDQLLIDSQAAMGNSWSRVAQMIAGRSENEVKNRWYSAVIRKKLLLQKQSRDFSQYHHNREYRALQPVPSQRVSSSQRMHNAVLAFDNNTRERSPSNSSSTDHNQLSEDDQVSLRIAEVYLKSLRAVQSPIASVPNTSSHALTKYAPDHSSSSTSPHHNQSHSLSGGGDKTRSSPPQTPQSV
eukprot:gene32297-39876_t